MRFYVFSVQYNKDAQAENRSVPKAFDNRNDAIKEFHSQLAKDMGNATLGWSLCMVINSDMGIEASEKYIADEVVAEAELADANISE